HGREVGLHGGVAVGLRDLRIAAGEEFRLRRDALGGGLLCDGCRLLGGLVCHCVDSAMNLDGWPRRKAPTQIDGINQSFSSSTAPPRTSPCQDHFGMHKPSGTSPAEWW